MKSFILLVIFSLSVLCAQAGRVAFEGEVIGDQAYELSFDANGANQERWTLVAKNHEGTALYDGFHAQPWQVIHEHGNRHLFYAPADARKVELRVPEGVEIQNAVLKRLEPDNLVLNGGFEAGAGNYSGWTERFRAEFDHEDGVLGLLVQRNGFALSDYIPVHGGGVYQMKKTGKGGFLKVAAYDHLRHLVTLITPDKGMVSVPAGVRYLRFVFETGNYAQRGNQFNRVEKMELTRVSMGEEAPAIQQCDRYEVVVDADCDPREANAARELVYWMWNITGKAPSLLAEPSGKGRTPIYIGRSWADAFPDELAKLAGTDGYCVKKKDGAIYVFGGKPESALFGVSALLERNTDIIWPRPQPGLSAFFTAKPEIEFAETDFSSIPVFPMRVLSNNPNRRKMHEFQAWQGRNGLNSHWPLQLGTDYFAWLFGATPSFIGGFDYWLADARVKDENVAAIIDNKRTTNRAWAPCFSYPGSAEGIAAKIVEVVKSIPEWEFRFVTARIADSWAVCSCPECMEPITLPDGEVLSPKSSKSEDDPLFFSTRHFMMLNRVAELVTEKYPDMKIGTHAYLFTAEPPAVPVHPSIVPEFAAYPTSNLRIPILAGVGREVGRYQADTWKRRFEAWGEKARGHLSNFGYYYVGYTGGGHGGGFNALADSAAADFQALQRFGALRVHTEGWIYDEEAPNDWDADGIEKWAMARLMWDPNQDPEELRAHYIARVYRGAEAEMTEFFRLIRESWNKDPNDYFVSCHSSSRLLFEALIVNRGIEKDLLALLEKAQKAVKDPRAEEKVRRHIAFFKQLGDQLGRKIVSNVGEADEDLQDLSSPHWEKAETTDGFMQVAKTPEPAARETTVDVLHNERFLYFRFTGKFPKDATDDDRFEFRFKDDAPGFKYFSVAKNGELNVPTGWQAEEVVVKTGKEDGAWSAVIGLPMSMLQLAGDNRVLAFKPGRSYRNADGENEETTFNGSALFNNSPGTMMNLHIQ